MKTFVDVRPFVGGKILDNTNVSVDDGKIVAIGDQKLGELLDCKGAMCVAGFIELHSHGGWGKDCMETSYEAIDIIAKYQLSTGITSFYPTTLTASMQDTDKAIDNIRQYAKTQTNGARILGVHMEGPYLALKSAGAHPPKLIVAPTEQNTEVVWKNLDMVKRITIAPDRECAAEFTKKAVQNGVQVSLGHDDSIDDEILECVHNGASTVTHEYNCTSKPSRRSNPKKHLGLTEMGLICDELVCEVIADDRHVPNSLFGMIYKIKGADHICLVSDSLSVAGESEGEYYIGSGESKQRIAIEDGVAILPDLNTYAGSVTPISKMVKNLLGMGLPVQDILSMGTLVPAKVMGLEDRGDIQVGMLADFNLMDDTLDILDTYIGGERVDKTSLR